MTNPTPPAESVAQDAALPTPLAFLSYSHTSPEYSQRVLDLAGRLVGHGVRVILDQWDLREGQDLHTFMEQAVNNAEVSHVLILCDPRYAAKADDRSGGVGSETLILSPDVYQNVNQSRVVPVIMQRDEHDQIVVPTYLKGRFYVDLSTPEREAAGYEQLVRTLFGRPSHARPTLGAPPAFLEESYVPLRTAGAATIALAALAGDRSDAAGRLADYLDRLADVLASEEITTASASVDELKARVDDSVERLKAYRDEFLGVVRVAARYASARTDVIQRLHAFFERFVTVRLQHRQLQFREEVETENLAFTGWEFFLCAVAVLLAEQQYARVPGLLQPLYVRTRGGSGHLTSFDALEPGFTIITAGGPRNWLEPAAQLLRERLGDNDPTFESVMEADLLLWFRAATDGAVPGQWFPRTLAYTESLSHLPLFARAQAPSQFALIAPAFGVTTRADFVHRFQEISDDRFYPIGRAFGNRGRYAQLLGIRSDETAG